MIHLNCIADNHEARLFVYDDRLEIKNETNQIIHYTSIKSLHVKNEEKYLLKIKSENFGIILEFQTMHIRDFVKTIILSAMSTVEAINKNVISANSEFKNLLTGLKGTLNNSQVLKSIDKHESLYLQKNNHPGPADAPMALNQSLVDVFIEMNCSIEQFYNLLLSSYFYDIKNQKNSIDRLLSDRSRNFSSKIDYATRINTYSILNCSNIDNSILKEKQNRQKPVEFHPYFHQDKTDILESTEGAYVLCSKPLTAVVELEDEADASHFEFDPADFVVARDMCKIVYNNTDKEIIEEATKFSASFLNLIEGKYGKQALKYVGALVPTFYIKK